MSNNIEFPFAKARRITPEEVNRAKIAIQKQFGDEYIARSKDDDYELISLKINPKIITWAKKEAEKQGINYQVFINNELLKLCSSCDRYYD
jgi:predicted DNA binding CopG/RHH family protein